MKHIAIAEHCRSGSGLSTYISMLMDRRLIDKSDFHYKTRDLLSDVVDHSPFTVLSYKEVLLGLFTKTNRVSVIHSDPLYIYWSQRTLRGALMNYFLLLLVYFTSGKIILLSEKFVVRYPFFLRQKLVTIETAIDCVESVNLNRPFEFIVLGRLHKDKNVKEILEIFAQNNKRINVYGDGPERVNLEKEFTNENIRFMGYLNEVSAVLSKSKFILMASNYEGMPFSILEAKAYGCIPVVCDYFLTAADCVSYEYGHLVANISELRLFVESRPNWCRYNEKRTQWVKVQNEKNLAFTHNWKGINDFFSR